MRTAVREPRKVSRSSSLRGYSVHAYTASGLVLMAASAHLLLTGNRRWSLILMELTIFIDATDGVLARRWRVTDTAATIDGRRLDDIVDFLGFVFLPMLFMLEADLLLAPATLFASLPLFASAFGFSRVTAKQPGDGFFVGFPSYWNIVVGYLYVLSTPPWFNTAVVILLAFMVFVPLRYMYLTQLPRHRKLQCGIATAWGILCLGVLLLPHGPWKLGLAFVSLAYPIYYTAYSLHLDRETRTGRRRTRRRQAATH